jgi:hypothetical protein
MGNGIDALLQRMSQLPELLVYVVVGLFAAIENVFPPGAGGHGRPLRRLPGRQRRRQRLDRLPGRLAGQRRGGAAGVLDRAGATASASSPRAWGRLILQPQQLQKLDDFYRRRGTIVIFVSRFLPMFRAVVPGLRGDERHLAADGGPPGAGGVGAVVRAGGVRGRHGGGELGAIRAGLESLGRWIYLVALLLAAAVAWVWWRSRDRSGAQT